MESIVAFARLYVTVQLLSTLTLPLTQSVMHRLPDRGYCLNKAAGIFVTGLVLWLGTAYGLLRNDSGGAWLSLASVAVVSALAGKPLSSCLLWMRRSWPVVLAAELLFLLAFAAWTSVRYLDPGIHHTEQPMDLMLMNAIHENPLFPPRDPWLAGYPIAYYYLGYWLMNGVGRLAGITPDIGYNALQACWYSLLVLGSFGLGYNICRLCRRRRSRQRRRALFGGLLAAVSVGVVGNLRFFVDLIGSTEVWTARPGAVLDSDWWWRASRVIQDRSAAGQPVEIITEFPAFSYVLGDNHPHVLAMPFLLVVLGLALDLLVGAAPSPARWGLAGVCRARLLAASIFSGGLLFLNAWDYPLAVLLLVACFWAGSLRESPPGRWYRSILPALAFAAALGAIAVAVYLPYLLTAQSQVRGLAVNLSNPTPLSRVLLMFGVFVPGCVALLVLGWRRFQPPAWRVLACVLSVSGVALVLLAAGSGSMTIRELGTRAASALGAGAIGLAGFGAVLWTGLAGIRTRRSSRNDDGLWFVLLLAAAGLLFVLTPELVYLVDLFETRMNTVFKFYYQGWMLLGIASACGIAIGLRRGAVPTALACAGLLVTGLGLTYPALALHSKTWGRAQRGVPNALDQLRMWSADESRAVAWVRQHVPYDAVLVEAEGQSYHPEQNRISTFTGRSTLLGWTGHEAQWRGGEYSSMAAGRSETLETIYRTGSSSTIAEALADWGVDYVYLGPAERSRYGVSESQERLLQQVMDRVFESGSVRIYRTRGEIRR